MVTITAAEERAEAKTAYDALLQACPSQRLVAQISGKWVTLVIATLGSGPDCTGDPRPMRYSELAKVLASVSPKMLTQTLKSLERDGLITRTAEATVPPTVHYELTELGVSLHHTVRELRAWSELHSDQVEENRRRFDAARKTP